MSRRTARKPALPIIRARKTPPVCRKQHVVPRFVISRFSPIGDAVVWVKDMDDKITSTGAGDSRFHEQHLYSDALDYSWSGYESKSAAIVSSLCVSANAVRQSDYFISLLEMIAGMIARDRRAMLEFNASTWSYNSQRLSNDQIRCLVFNAVLSALLVADVRLLRSNRPIMENERGYAWDQSTKRLLVPVSLDLCLVITWDDHDPNGMPARVIDLSRRSRRLGKVQSIDADYVNELIAWQACETIVSADLQCFDRFSCLGDDARFLQWLSSWMPASACYTWAPVISEVLHRESWKWDPAITGSTASVDVDMDSLDLDTFLKKNVKNIGEGSWAPVWLLRPDRGDVLWNAASSASADRIIVDYSQKSDWDGPAWGWIPYEASYYDLR